VTRLLAGQHRVQTLLGARYFFLQNFLDQLWGPPYLIQWAPGCSFSGVKQLGREVDYSSQVSNGWSYASTPPLCLHGTARDNFTLFMYYTVAGEKVPLNSPSKGPRNCYASSLAYFRVFFSTWVATLFIYCQSDCSWNSCAGSPVRNSVECNAA